MKTTGIFLSFLLIFFVSAAQTQDGTPVEYGQVMTGEITNQAYEVPYNFSGNQGDVIVILMKPVDPLGDLSSPEIILLDKNSNLIADTSGSFSISAALLAIELPSSDSYTVLASRADGRAGDSVGEFILEIIKLEELIADEVFKDTISSEGRENFYLVRNEGASFTLSYEKVAGEFAPQISVNRIDENHGLTQVVGLFGEDLTKGSVNIPLDSGIYIINVAEALFDFNFEEVTADYNLLLTGDE